MRVASLTLLVALVGLAGGSAPAGRAPAPAPAAPPAAVPAEPAAPAVTEILLRPRETLESALLRGGVGRADAGGIVRSLSGFVNLRRLRPGERLLLSRPADGQPPEVTYWHTPTARFEVRRQGEGWTARPVHVPVSTRVVAIAGQVERSLFASMEHLGEDAALTAKFVGLFEWDFDFAADALPGDRFRALVEKRYAEGEFIGYGDILIAQYASEDRALLTAVAFRGVEARTAYFDAHGRSVRKAFLRAPLDFTRITSGYSQARRHPVLGGLRPHLAVDYAAPTGTPVRAVADGVVEQAGWNGGNGISVTLRHAHGYRTMYNHLSRAHVRSGQRVQQRDLIGRVGSTGLSTGPHLDYRVIRNGRFVNPLSERFIPGAPVPRARLEEFRRHLEGLRGRLEREAPFPSATRSS